MRAVTARCRGPIALLFVATWAAQAVADEPKLDFNRQIRPILSDACFKCHGFDDKTRMADLRLDTLEGATAKLESGAVAVVPGKMAESELVRRITSTDDAERMPPEGSGKTLSPAQIELLKKWVEQGAEYKQHWSFIPPVQPTPPEVSKHKAAIRNPIDNFILARLEQEKLTPAAPTDQVTLLRRVTLDLTGLPPTPSEVDAFRGRPVAGSV